MDEVVLARWDPTRDALPRMLAGLASQTGAATLLFTPGGDGATPTLCVGQRPGAAARGFPTWCEAPLPALGIEADLPENARGMAIVVTAVNRLVTALRSAEGLTAAVLAVARGASPELIVAARRVEHSDELVDDAFYAANAPGVVRHAVALSRIAIFDSRDALEREEEAARAEFEHVERPSASFSLAPDSPLLVKNRVSALASIAPVLELSVGPSFVSLTASSLLMTAIITDASARTSLTTDSQPQASVHAPSLRVRVSAAHVHAALRAAETSGRAHKASAHVAGVIVPGTALVLHVSARPQIPDTLLSSVAEAHAALPSVTSVFHVPLILSSD